MRARGGDAFFFIPAFPLSSSKKFKKDKNYLTSVFVFNSLSLSFSLIVFLEVLDSKALCC